MGFNFFMHDKDIERKITAELDKAVTILEAKKDKILGEMSSVDKETLTKLRMLMGDYYNAETTLSEKLNSIMSETDLHLSVYGVQLSKLNDELCKEVKKYIQSYITEIYTREKIATAVTEYTEANSAGYLTEGDIVQSTGTATDKVMSQNAVTNEIDIMRRFIESTDDALMDEINSAVETLKNSIYTNMGTGLNKLNPDTVIYGFALNDLGKAELSEGRAITDYIPCYGETVFSCANSIQGLYCAYDENKAFIGGYTPTSRNGQTIPNGAYYIRIGMAESVLDGQMVVFAETADGLAFEAFEDAKLLKSDIKITLENLAEDITSLFDITETLNSFSEELKNSFFGEKSESLNRYNNNADVHGYTLNSSGELVTMSGRVTSDYIPCYGETVFSCANSILSNYYFYDENKNFVSFHAPSSRNGLPIPAGVHYLRIITSEANAPTQMVIFAETAVGVPYEAYSSKTSLHPDIIVTEKNLESVKHLLPNTFNFLTELFNGCTIKLIGDSITHGVGGTGFTNDAENGELIMSAGSSFYTNPNGHCWANLLKSYLEEKFSSVTVHANGTRGESYHTFQLNSFSRLKQLVTATDETDIVIMMFGTNDRNYCTDVSDMITKASSIIEYITKTCGKKLILMTAPPASVDNETGASVKFHMEDVANANKFLAEKYQLPFINIYKEFINRITAKGEEINTYLDDGLHPNDNGYTLMFEIIADNLNIALKRNGATW